MQYFQAAEVSALGYNNTTSIVPKAFANQNASTKVLRFEGIYAFITSISHRFLRLPGQRRVAALGRCCRGISYC